MIKQFLHAICLVFFCGFGAHAQTQYSYYFDNDINLVEKSHGVFQGIGGYVNGIFELKVFDIKRKKLLILEHFTDSSLQLSQGLFVSFLPNGNKEWEGNYLSGKQDGLWKKWNWKGEMTDSSIFNGGQKISENIYDYYPGGKLKSTDIFSAANNKREMHFFDEKGNELTPHSNNDPDKIFYKVEAEASFPGGLAAWSKYISRTLEFNMNEFRKEDYGTCVIRFIVDTSGKVHDIVAGSGCGKHISKVAIDAIKNGPKWIPAKQNGRPVNAYRIQPITLQHAD